MYISILKCGRFWKMRNDALLPLFFMVKTLEFYVKGKRGTNIEAKLNHIHCLLCYNRND